MNSIKKTFQYGQNQVSFETGNIARQATAAVMVNVDDTVVLVSVVGKKEAVPGQDFFPLTVNYQEKTYSAGKIPGGFLKREARPSEKETLTCRLIDRPIRPLFPKGFTNEVQVIATLVSLNPEVDPEIPALLGTSAALAISGLPFSGPLGAARVGYVDDQLVLNPSKTQMETSRLDLVVAGTKDAVLMVESEADILPEDIMLDAVMFGHDQMQTAIQAINELQAEAGKPAWEWQAAAEDTALKTAVAEAIEDGVREAYKIQEKQARGTRLGELKQQVIDTLAAPEGEEGWSSEDIAKAVGSLEKSIVRNSILDGEPRIDGRDTSTVRGLDIQTGVLPRTHGSAVFTRGETQALVVTTLGTDRDAQIIDALGGEYRDRFMLHYNFPPYCVGEAGFMGSTKRREIGHGRLAKRGLMAVMPGDDFPYVVRVVSEITESNGSSSMASVCGSSLAMMDAGVPLKAPVAGIAMGLIKEGDRHAVLTDILGDEDHLGDMDFKVAGTESGVTALQMDIKIQGITRDIMSTALAQAQDARLHILKQMNEVLSTTREEMSEFAPRIQTIKVHPDKIRDIIGKGGITIRSITEETGASVDIDDDGTVRIASTDQAGSDAAIDRIKALTAEAEVGMIYEGKVSKLMDFGAFITILPGKDGLCHISQIANERVENVGDHMAEGDTVRVKVLEIDKQGRIRLSIKAIEEGE